MIRVLLPAYNEEASLEPLCRKFKEAMESAGLSYRLVVYDDGSSDGTRRKAEELSRSYPVDVAFHARNAGLGRTMIDGLKLLDQMSSDEDVWVTMDCDDTHEPKYIPGAVAKLAQAWDVVILSRYAAGGSGQEGLSGFKKLMSRGAGVFLKIFFPIRGVAEYSCNYRVYRASFVRRAMRAMGDRFIELDRWGFVVAPEVLIRLRMAGARITEFPFVLRYDQKTSPSKNRTLKTLSGYFVLVSRCWGRRVALEPEKNRS